MFKTETEMKTVAALAVICLLVVDVRDRQETPEEGVYVMMVASKCSVEIGLRSSKFCLQAPPVENKRSCKDHN
ncbi:hypothetical protein MHYP_G00257130 [Metynnis hypsauchen]